MVRSRHLGRGTPCRARVSHRLQSAACAGAERRMTALTLTPGRATLADWHAIADGASVQLDPAAMPAIEASARAVDAIIARGGPVYGINTRCGKLASVNMASGA